MKLNTLSDQIRMFLTVAGPKVCQVSNKGHGVTDKLPFHISSKLQQGGRIIRKFQLGHDSFQTRV